MRISEIYGPVSQGEGLLIGERMPFIRVAGCNLACSWCDSKYTWQQGYSYTEMSVEQVAEQALRLCDGTHHWVSVTGGEPTLYARELSALVAALAAHGVQTIIETNGLRDIAAFQLPSVFVSCSPKLPGSGQDTPARRAKVQRLVASRTEHGLLRTRTQLRTQFKFVIACDRDLDELPDYCASIGLPTDGSALVYVQPDGYIQPLERYLDKLRWLQERAPAWCRVTPQVHRLVHGPDARSV